MAMNLQGLKHVVAIATQSLATTATATGNSIDTKGYDELQIVLVRATHASDAITTFTIEQSDDDSTYATVTGYVQGTDYTVASIIGGTSQAAAQPAVFNIDLRGKKRYFRCKVTPATSTSLVGATAILARAAQAPITAANANVTQLVNPT